MSEAKAKFEARLGSALQRRLAGFRKLRRWSRLSGGASQETYRLEVELDSGDRVLAMRRTAGGVWYDEIPAGRAGIETEALLMRLARDAGVPEPEVLACFEREDEIGQGFVMEWLDGETLGARIVRGKELADVRPRLARECGEVLARIHAIDLERSGLADRLQRLDPRAYVEQIYAGYQTYQTPQPMIDFVARWLLDHLPQTSRRALVHNDFRNGNLMIGPQGVVAVLDWEIAHIGDPMRDLGWICTNSWRFGQRDLAVGGFGVREDLYAGYQAVSGLEVDPNHVHFWEVFGSWWWAVGCLQMAAAFRAGPDPSVERAAIGRRTSECQVDCVNLLIPGPVEVLEPPTSHPALDLPRADELVVGARDFLRRDVMEVTEGRLRFLSRVASNALDLVTRELAVGAEHRAQERERLAALLARQGDLESLRGELAAGLRDGTVSLDHPGLAAHLRTTVVNQVAIDQPTYSGYLVAVEAD